MGDGDKRVLMAMIGAAHGVRGAVRVKSFTADPMALAGYGPLWDAAGRRFEIVEARPQKDMLVVTFKGVSDRDAAEALNRTELYVDRSALPADLDDDEFYHADLIGLDVEDETGARLGRVKAVFDHGGGDILEVTLSAGGSVLVPFTRAAAPLVDLSEGRIVLDRAAAGLVDDPEDDGHTGDGADEPVDDTMSDDVAEAPAKPRARAGRPKPDRRPGSGFDTSRRPRGPRSAGGNR